VGRGAVEDIKGGDGDWRDGKRVSYVFYAGGQAERVAKKAYKMFLSENALDPTVFHSVLKFETELVAIAASHLGGDDDTVGNFTSGGTESIILAVKAARDHARFTRGDSLGTPEMILPVTAHAAFHKAAHYLGVKPVVVDVDTETFAVDAEAMRAAITKNTVLLVGSAPGYSQGVMDPIAELGQLALEHDLLLHVDGCMGGWLLPYLRKAGYEVPYFDFSVPGVTSISVDLHKYAYAPKGASLVLYKSDELRRHQMYACSEWTGYTIVNAAVQSSRSGGPMAAAWAVVHHIGDEGYIDLAKELYIGTRKVVEGVQAIDGLHIQGDPAMALVAIGVDGDAYALADAMNARGWYVQPQFAYAGVPTNIHLTITPGNLHVLDDFIAELEEVWEDVRDVPAPSATGPLAMMAKALDPATMTDDMVRDLLGMVGIQGGAGLPNDRAEINRILEQLPPAVANRLLLGFFNELYKYR